MKVCELYCGGGGVDADKWDECQIGHYIGIGISFLCFVLFLEDDFLQSVS